MMPAVFGPTAAFESALLVLAIWWVWINTTWVTNLLHTGFVACDSYSGGEAAMAALQCPVLFVLGEQDQMTPPKAAKGLVDAAKAAGQRVKLQTIPNGHNQMSESPDDTLFAIRDFLAA